MKKVYLLALLLSTALLSAQVQNQFVQDCDGLMKNIHSTLGSGKVLLIVSKGFDCSICMSQAAGLQTKAALNAQFIEVWAAMTNTYSTTTPGCAEVDQWVQDYSWNDVYTFIDSNELWFSTGTPQFYVYNPADSTLVYHGFSESEAWDAAANVSTPVAGLNDSKPAQIEIGNGNGFISFKNLPEQQLRYQLLDITGKSVKTGHIKGGVKERVITENLKSGIYMIKFEDGHNFLAVRKVYIR